jgi:two-component system NtrC family sensor kinase
MKSFSKIKLTLGTKLLLGYFLVVGLMGIFTIYAGLSFITETVVKEAIARVQMDLNSAWLAFNEEKALIQTAVMLAAQNDIIKEAITQSAEKEEIINCFADIRQKSNLDFLTLINKKGITIGGSSTTTSFGSMMREDPIIQQALSGNVANGTILIPQSKLLIKNKELADRATISIIETKRARPTDRKVEDRGMVLETAVPIFNVRNEILGVLYGGILLNRKFELVDRIRDNIFQDEVYAGKPLGTVTIFLWDVRIATNVIKVDSTRAIGTRVSDEVYTKVLEQGERLVFICL